MKHARILYATLACLLFAGLAGCFKSPVDMPHQSVITSDGHTLTPPDCSDLESPSQLTDAGLRRPSVSFGCATYTNLAAQIAHPEHFNHPVELGPADAAMAASAVNRYENGKAEKVDTSSSRDSK